MPEEIDTSNMSAEEIAELQKQNCIFCKIAEKQIPAKVIHEDIDVICVLDINPASEGHILVFPKKHYMILPHIPDETLGRLFTHVKLMSHTLLKT
ncbi:MAG: HIT domain-containing protein, partial [Candidatus Woesearchaeota archaeon]